MIKKIIQKKKKKNRMCILFTLTENKIEKINTGIFQKKIIKNAIQKRTAKSFQ